MQRDSYSTFVVVNPNASNRSTGKQWPRIAARLEEVVGPFAHAFTDRPLHASELTRQALSDGYQMVVSVGGDGTHNEVVNGFFEGRRPVAPEAVFGIVPCGTGGDLRKTVNIPKPLDQAVMKLWGKTYRTVDVGLLRCVDFDGAPCERRFINIASFGIGGEVDRRVNTTSKALGGFISFLIASAKAILSYRNKEVEIEVDGRTLGTRKVFMAAACNGQFFGGGMWVAPHAQMDDGQFEIVIEEDLSLFEVVRDNPQIYKGRHLLSPKVSWLRGKKLCARASRPELEVLIDMDGETPGRLPIEIEILESALRFKV
jgi:YegS/Rv2252/BmrU family lipid kinase